MSPTEPTEEPQPAVPVDPAPTFDEAEIQAAADAFIELYRGGGTADIIKREG